MNYFEVPPERETEAPPPREWTRPPLGEVGVEVALEQIVAETPGTRLRLSRLVVYSSGFAVDLLLDWREDAVPRAIRGSIFNPHDDAFVRFAIEFPGGARATNLDRWSSQSDEEDEGEEDDREASGLPTAPALGFGVPFADANNMMQFNSWIWGIPEPGDVALVIEWPVGGIAATRVPLDGTAIRAAAERSQLLWPAT